MVRRKWAADALTIAAACLVAGVRSASLPKVETFERHLTVDGREFNLKGVNWNPVRKGGSLEDLDFRGFVETDADLMWQAGINAVRTFSPITDIDVLDALWKRGIYVLMSVYVSAKEPISALIEPVKKTKSHPAVMMWLVGNEWNYNGLYRHWPIDVTREIVKDAAELIRTIDSTRPIGSVYGGMPDAQTVRELSEAIDIWGINQYEESSFGGLFEKWAKLPTVKPMFLSEYGADAFDSRRGRPNEEAQAEATRRLTEEILRHTSQRPGGVCVGHVVFELADELWKSGSPDRHDIAGATHNVYGDVAPDDEFNEEWWGLVRYDGTPRAAFREYAQMDSPGCSASSDTAGCSRKLPSDVSGDRLRACGASAQCSGRLGMCCPDDSGVYSSCCDKALLPGFAANPATPGRGTHDNHGDHGDGEGWHCGGGFYFRFSGTRSWPAEKRRWCCERERVGCDGGEAAEKFSVSDSLVDAWRRPALSPLPCLGAVACLALLVAVGRLRGRSSSQPSLGQGRGKVSLERDDAADEAGGAALVVDYLAPRVPMLSE
mmetsp:Transcript_116495/g.336511  ORF Transcript_116495/g.336511 Transcript_116495/m.336511 type:complete len:547 (+) Transcript_116495:132-1772(+)